MDRTLRVHDCGTCNNSETGTRVSLRGTNVAYLTSFPDRLSIAVDFGVARRVILVASVVSPHHREKSDVRNFLLE